MRPINSDAKKLSVTSAQIFQSFKHQNWVCISAAASLFLLAVLWAAVPQMGQAQGAVPAQPTGLTATADDGQATLGWDDPSDNSITGYEYLQAQVAKLTASDGDTGDDFGDSVSLDGDTMVVGAPFDDDHGSGSGSAYVFTRQSGAWNQVAKLTASDGAARDHFGYSVAVDGDTVVVGAEERADYFKGSAYLFTKPANGGWASTSTAAKLTASDGDTRDRFGRSVSVDGDTVVVGARLDDDNGSDSGSAYLFTKPAGGWTTATGTAKLTASDGGAPTGQKPLTKVYPGLAIVYRYPTDCVMTGICCTLPPKLQTFSSAVILGPIDNRTKPE